jgi:hypothetical protein
MAANHEKGVLPMKSVALSIVSALALSVLACGSEGPAEQAGREIDEAVEDVREAGEETLDDAGDALDEAADEVSDAADEARKKARETVD